MALDRIFGRPHRLMRRTPSAMARADRARDARHWELAAQLYRKALDRNPRNSGIWVQYGHALKESGELRDPDKLGQAESAYRTALSLNPGAADSYLQLGHVLKLQGKTEEAKASYLRAFALDPSMPYPLQELSGLGWSEAEMAGLRGLVGSNLPPASSSTLECTPRNDARRGLKELGLGILRRKSSVIDFADRARDARQWERAAQLYRKALDRNRRNPPIWVQYGHALKESGERRDPDKLAQAETAYRRALALDPGVADPHLQLGHVLKLQGRTEEARGAYLRAFALDHSLDSASLELSQLGWSAAHFSELRSMLETNVVVNQSGSTNTSSVAQAARAGSLDPDRDAVLRTIEREFDAQFYLTKYPDVRAAQLDALQHFVDFGWKEGRDPNASFSTGYYLKCNADVRNRGINPLLHYVVSGRAERRLPSPSARAYRGYNIPYDIDDRNPVLRLPVQTGREKANRLDPSTRLAVHIHVFYLDCLPQILSYIKAIPEKFNLYISTDEQSKLGEIATVLGDLLAEIRSEFRLCPNRGRDIAPFLLSFKDVFGKYEYWLHLHTKKSIDKPGLGPRWMTHNLDHLLHDSRYIRSILTLLDQEHRCGMVIPVPADEIRSFMDWGRNHEIASGFLKTLDIDAAVLDAFPLFFPAGNMFWCRSSALERIVRNPRLSFTDFPEEPIPDDGTLAHALERLLPYVSHHDGFHYRVVEPLPADRMPNPRTDYLLTVVIPAYNAASWLHHSIQSVLSQELTASPIEIIVVDNDSNDDTAAICRFYSQSFTNIRCFHENTRGAGAARNLGIRKARGKYICFLDADDMLAFDGLESLLGLAIDNNADLITSSLCMFTESDISCPDPEFAGSLIKMGPIVKGEQVLLPDTPVGKDVERMFADFGPCAKLYKMEFLRQHQIEFPIETNYEDNLFVFQAYLTADLIVVHPRPTYFYRKYVEYSGKTQSTVISDQVIADQMRILHRVLDLIRPNFCPAITELIHRKVLTKVAWLFDTGQPIEDHLVANKEEVGRLFKRAAFSSLVSQWSGDPEHRDRLYRIANLLAEDTSIQGQTCRRDSAHGIM
jgi:glycosyltransferase involved in cell wall biosynthesis/tetratricopeptide (TPR) repeat protein